MTDAANSRPYYVTTSILYANASPHVGHTFEMFGADVMARGKRLLGYDVYFQIGTDEHGQKMLEYAERANMEPQAYGDKLSSVHRDLWDTLDISYDRFIRTTDEDHYNVVEQVWKTARDNDDIYLDKYDGWYCVTDENFVLENQAIIKPDQVDKKFCPDCGGELNWKSEESYFFRWSKYQGFVEQWLKDNPNFVAPKFRANEMINSFLKPGLQDISVSRTSIKWGVPVPDDPKHVIYVWFDALINYITGVGYGSDSDRFARYWPADMHIVGKDILKFHTLLWPAMCKSIGIEPPRHVFGHGFVSPRAVAQDDGPEKLRDTIRWEKVDGGVEVFDGNLSLGIVHETNDNPEAVEAAIIAQYGATVMQLAKMSKSRGNIVDPLDVIARYNNNPDPLRYFLLKEIDFGGDGIYSDEAVEASYNADLADKLGNLLSRTLTMVEKYQGGLVNQPGVYTEEDDAVRDTIRALFQSADHPDAPEGAPRHVPGEPVYTLYERLLDQCEFSFILERIMAATTRLNLYITETQPFRLAKDPANADRLRAILYVLVEGLRIIAVQLYPFIPRTAQEIWRQVGGEGRVEEQPFEALRQWGYLDNVKITRGDNLFPKEQKPRD